MAATTAPRTVRARSVLLLDQLRELLAAVESGEVPAGPAYRHRVEGGMSAALDDPLEARAQRLRDGSKRPSGSSTSLVAERTGTPRAESSCGLPVSLSCSRRSLSWTSTR